MQFIAKIIAVIVSVLSPGDFFGEMLDFRPIQYVLSYANLYLFHTPTPLLRSSFRVFVDTYPGQENQRYSLRKGIIT